MADRDEGLGLARQQLLEPEDALDVEVVRRLVEQQQLGLADQRARDRQPLLPAAGERRTSRCVAVGEAGLAERDGDAALDLVLVERLGRAAPRAAPTPTRRAVVEDRVLRHVADAQPLARRARARGRLLEAGEDLQQRRLAGAVRADEADVVALEDAEREAPRRAAPRRRPSLIAWQETSSSGHQRAGTTAATPHGGAARRRRLAVDPPRRAGTSSPSRGSCFSRYSCAARAPRAHAARPDEPHRQAGARVARGAAGLVLPQARRRSLAAPGVERAVAAAQSM